MKIEYGVEASEALQSAKHKVFVEGGSDGEIDPVVLDALLRTNGLAQIDVAAMGGCSNVRSAAQALVNQHPSYYFIIDRDDQNHVDVERSWDEFPDITTHNLIIWRKRELENYFCDPDYLKNCDYLSCEPEKLSETILKECRRRMFMEAANLAILAIHRELKRPVAKHFANVSKFKTSTNAENELISLASIIDGRKQIGKTLSTPSLKRLYRQFVAQLSGGTFPLEFGHGEWLQLMSGKEIFRSIAGPCFEVLDVHGKKLTGKPQNIEIARNLLSKPLAIQPFDFQEIIRVFTERAKE